MSNVFKIKNSSSLGSIPSGLVAGELCINIKDKKLFFLDDLGVLQSFDLVAPAGTVNRQVIKLASLYSSGSQLRANIPEMSFAVTAGKSYRIQLIGSYQSVSTTTGLSIGFILSSGTGGINGFVTMSVSQNTVATDLTTTIRSINSVSSTAGSFATSSGVSVINSPHYFNCELVFDCLTTGVFNVQFGSESVSTSVQMNAGSMLIIETLN